MGRIEEEQKLERIHQARQDPYQQYQTYLESLDMEENQVQQSGKIRGKKVKQLKLCQFTLLIQETVKRMI